VVPPWLPRIESPEGVLLREGKRECVASFADAVLSIQKFLAWRLVFRCSASCGETWERTVERKVGLSLKSVAELSSSLGWSVKTLKSELSAKLKETISYTEEIKTSDKQTITAPKCWSLVHTDWQLFEIYRVEHRSHHWFRRPSTAICHVEVGLPIFETSTFTYERPDCCLDHERPGRPHPVIIDLGNHLVALLASIEERDKIVIPRLGTFKYGDHVSVESLLQNLPFLRDQRLTGNGTIRFAAFDDAALYRDPEIVVSHPTEHPDVPAEMVRPYFCIGCGLGVLLGVAFAPNKRGESSLESETATNVDPAREMFEQGRKLVREAEELFRTTERNMGGQRRD